MFVAQSHNLASKLQLDLNGMKRKRVLSVRINIHIVVGLYLILKVT